MSEKLWCATHNAGYNGSCPICLKNLEQPAPSWQEDLEMLGANIVDSSDDEIWIDEMLEALSRLKARMERYQTWVNDLQAGMYINCVYCGQRYGPDKDIPGSMADVLKQHIETCPEHPMSELKARMEELEKNDGVQKRAFKELIRINGECHRQLKSREALAELAEDIIQDCKEFNGTECCEFGLITSKRIFEHLSKQDQHTESLGDA